MPAFKLSKRMVLVSILVIAAPFDSRAEAPVVEFKSTGNGSKVLIGGKEFADYRLGDEQTTRPYLAHLRTPSGVQVTRNHPPQAGKDLDDHPTFHPGLWLAFGDVSGADFWRNRAAVSADVNIEVSRGAGKGTLLATYRYEANGAVLCTESCQLRFAQLPEGNLILWDSTFRTDRPNVTFGDQEEMGLGIRLASPLAVVRGGTIRNSDGLVNEANVWGKTADWCEYSGLIDGKRVGVALMPHPSNFRRSWFHARDYGLLVANPFGRNAFTKGEMSAVPLAPGESLRLRFGVLVFDGQPDIAAVYRKYLELAKGQ